MAARADVLIEGYRPGVAERLGVGPEDCMAVNPALVYGRMTGWGQDGPLASLAGHDIGYIATAGALSMIGTADGPPVFPANLLGDYAGGSSTSPPASWPPCSPPAPPDTARWWTPPSSTAPLT